MCAMTGPAHEFLAVTAAIAVAQATDATLLQHAVIIGGAYGTARLPDTDQKLGIPHRTITHWPVLILAVVALVWLIVGHYLPGWETAAALGVLTGLGTHVLADGTTPAGVPLFGPVSTRPVRLMPPNVRFVADRSRAAGSYIAIPEQAALTLAGAGLVIYLYLLHAA